MVNLVHLLTLSALAATQTSASQRTGIIFLALACITCLVGWILTYTRLKGAHAERAQVQSSYQQLRQQQHSMGSQEREHAKSTQELRNQLATAKQDIATQRKKNHQSQEDIKKLRDQLKDLQGELERARNERPAFSQDTDRATATPSRMATESRTATPRHVAIDANTEAEVQNRQNAATTAAAQAVITLQEENEKLQQALQHAHKERDKMRTTLQHDREARLTTKHEMRRLRKRLDDLRKIDFVARNRSDLLEDKITTMGRQYYDAVSEIAVLKGEVPAMPTSSQRPS